MKIIFIFFTILFLTSCATNDPLVIETTCDYYGFFGGLWHGMILPFSCVVCIFSDYVVYSANNSGLGYDIGFFLGVAFLRISWIGFDKK